MRLCSSFSIFVIITNVITSSSSSSTPSATLDSVPAETKLSLPLKQNQTSPCFSSSQAFQGPTVDQYGRGLYYGPNEEVNQTTSSNQKPGSALWGKPSIQLSDGTTCCDSLTDVREYINYLDSTIIAYMALRQQFVVEAGRFKDSRASVRAVERAVGVVKAAETLASQHGLAPWIANISYTATLNSFTELELCTFEEDVRNHNLASQSP